MTIVPSRTLAAYTSYPACRWPLTTPRSCSLMPGYTGVFFRSFLGSNCRSSSSGVRSRSVAFRSAVSATSIRSVVRIVMRLRPLRLNSTSGFIVEV
jgi:hypothetical protein